MKTLTQEKQLAFILLNNFLLDYNKERCNESFDMLYEFAVNNSEFKDAVHSDKEKLIEFLESLELLLPSIQCLFKWQDLYKDDRNVLDDVILV